MTPVNERTEILNVNHPGKARQCDTAPYYAMKQAILAVLPVTEPGKTFAEISRAVMPHLPDTLFPDGAKAGWWLKAVQLDLEARGILVRARCQPLRLHVKQTSTG